MEASDRYVGRSTCEGCHATEARLWEGSHHDLAMQEATPETVLGDFEDATITANGVTSTFHRNGGRFFVRTDGPDGDLAEFEVSYTFGADPLQQYLVALPGGRLQALGLAWDARSAAEGGQRWFHLYPDLEGGVTDPLHWTRPSQNWNAGCAECHSTDLRKGFDPATRTYETTWSELDVSCEACHGPGARHVEIANALDAGSEPDEWGVVAGLPDARGWTFAAGESIATRTVPRDSDAEIEACAACHSRRATIAATPTPGGAMLDGYSVSLLREGLYHHDGQIRDEVYVYGSFVQSRMYRAGVTCSDCHDPHSLTVRAEGNALCASCHLASTYDDPAHHFHKPETPGAECVECHMPETTYMQVDPRRDHSIRIPRPESSREVGAPDACSGCHTDRSNDWIDRAMGTWYGDRTDQSEPSDAGDAGDTDEAGDAGADGGGFGHALRAARSGLPGSAATLGVLAADTSQPVIARATALAELSSVAGAGALGPISNALGNPDAFLRLGAAQGLRGRDPGTILGLAYPLLDDPVRAVRIEAARLLAAVPRSTLTPEQTAAIDRGVAEYEESQLVNADSPAALVGLGDLYAVRGQSEAAVLAYRTAIDVEPTYLGAHLNLADLHRASGRDDLGEQVLTVALDISPDAPGLHHAMGLLLVRLGRHDEAIAWLARAANVEEGHASGGDGGHETPLNARWVYVYGVALASGGEMDRAIEVLSRGLAVHPHDRDLLTGLATYHRELGRIDDAIRYAERLADVSPEDRGVREFLAELRGARR